MQDGMAIGTVADRLEKQEDELLVEVFILGDEMAGNVCLCRINLLLIRMEWNMFQESFQFSLLCKWICIVLGRYYYRSIACRNLHVCNSKRVWQYLKQNAS